MPTVTDAAYQRRRRRAIAEGTWRPNVDAAPVRAHVRSLLDAGLSLEQVARCSVVPRRTVGDLMYGQPERGREPTARLRTSTAEALMAVRADLDSMQDAALIDPTGTARRVQALCCMGWSMSDQARWLGLSDASLLRHSIAGVRLRASRARAVRAMYEALSMREGPSRTGMTKARRRGWAPPLAWDDEAIDDPGAEPKW